MKRIFLILLTLTAISSLSCTQNAQTDYCLTGAFLADSPRKEDITRFKASYGKKPYLVMVFVDWGRFVDEEIIRDVYSQNCLLCVTWEPQDAAGQKEIDYDKVLSGGYDQYIKSFAGRMKAIRGEVFLRFGHEMNGDWYPWSGVKIGQDKFKALYRYVKDIFDSEDAGNVKWVFSINWQNVPAQNNYILYYPGPGYVDYIGIDGYNWGDTQRWSRWMSFRDIFLKTYMDVANRFNKLILISEFSSTSSGGDKTRWIREAMKTIKSMRKIKAFILFNVDKEADWYFPAEGAAGKEFGQQLKDDYFRDEPKNYTLN